MSTRVVRFHKVGEADVLQIDKIDFPAPAADEVRISVKAFGLNRAESLFRQDLYAKKPVFPAQLGYEAAGVIESLGSDVSGFKVGDVVSVVPSLDMTKWPTHGELANVPARLVVKTPSNLSFQEAAASWMQYVTAWGALIYQAKLIKGDFLIVSAASSSVGIAAFQIARRVGATVIATTRTAEKKQALIDAGAHHVIITESENLVERVKEITNGVGARVAFDPIGGPIIADLVQALSNGGMLIEYGALSALDGAKVDFPQFPVVLKSLTIKGYLYWEVIATDEGLEAAKKWISEGLESGELKPIISREFPFEQIVEATRSLESNEQIGKIVVTL